MNELYRGMLKAAVDHAVAESRAAGKYANQVLKGRARELFVSNFLSPHLGPGVGVCGGVVIDASGGQSRQIDVIVYDARVIPPVLIRENEGIIPCESVLATIEVKSRLTPAEIDKAIRNARSIKLLKPEFRELKRTQNYKNSPICYLFAYESSAKVKPERDRLIPRVAKSNNLVETRIHVPLSAVCVANKSFVHCVDAAARPPVFEEVSEKIELEAVIRFVTHLATQVKVLALQREPITMDQYVFEVTPDDRAGIA